MAGEFRRNGRKEEKIRRGWKRREGRDARANHRIEWFCSPRMALRGWIVAKLNEGSAVARARYNESGMSDAAKEGMNKQWKLKEQQQQITNCRLRG
ncbi:unnamed protein product [Litomosoides sigmodontis]|uniref:Uncharacterized protein n=1 Tax=Litomosoides sigmodontis TaxID=42156 RepID=A0A3P6TMQ7_LITSI|nr:unnamed protein product [Litomosoides sigmodontis]